mmetsp:Transcript_13792/g.31274  ORF Transcript_13792/g.31274 Transcript_13792/m.31274 type:complete len:146 (+) Transcript_13792:51-488(+)
MPKVTRACTVDIEEDDEGSRRQHVLVRINGDSDEQYAVRLPTAFYKKTYNISGCSERQAGFCAHVSTMIEQEVTSVWYRKPQGSGGCKWARLDEGSDLAHYPLVPGMVLVVCIGADMGPPADNMEPRPSGRASTNSACSSSCPTM